MFGDYSTTHAAILTKLNGRKRRTVATGTVISVDDDNIARVTYRGTHVLTATPDGGVMLDTGGWPTQTTMRRMNDYLPAPWRVSGSTLRRGALPRKPRPWTVTSRTGTPCGHPWDSECGTCRDRWCSACDPSPASLCHACNGNGNPRTLVRVPFLDTGADGPTAGEPNYYTGQLGWGANVGNARMVAVLNTVTGEFVSDPAQVAA